MTSESAFIPYRTLMETMSPKRGASSTPKGGTPTVAREGGAEVLSPIAAAPSPLSSPYKGGHAFSGHTSAAVGSPGGTETDSLADMTVSAGGNAGASDQRFKRLSKQLQRSYQEKHLLLTEIQVMKDQLKQWHREKGKDRLESANGPAIAPIPGAEDNAWFALLDLNERANALALYYLYKGNTLKRKASAFRKWFRNCSVHSSGNVAPTAQKGFGDSEHLSTFEKRRLELLEMAAAVTAATSSLGSKSFDHMLRSRSEEEEGSQPQRRKISRSVSPPGRGQRGRLSGQQVGSPLGGTEDPRDHGSGSKAEPQFRSRTLFPTEDDSVATNENDYFYYDATGRHSSRESRPSRGGDKRKTSRGSSAAAVEKHSVPKLNIDRVQQRGRDSRRAPSNANSNSTLTAPTLSSHLRKVPFHNNPAAASGRREARQSRPIHTPSSSYSERRSSGPSSDPTGRGRSADRPGDVARGPRPVPSRSRSPSLNSSRSTGGVHMTNAAIARAAFISNNNKEQPVVPYGSDPRRQPRRRLAPRSKSREHTHSSDYSEGRQDRHGYGSMHDEAFRNQSRFRDDSSPEREPLPSRQRSDRKSYSDGMLRHNNDADNEKTQGQGGRMRASFPMRNRSESPQGRSQNRSQNRSGNKSFLNNSGVSMPPLPSLQREAHHVLLPTSPPDTDRSTVDNDEECTNTQNVNTGNRADAANQNGFGRKSPPPLPVTKDGMKLKQEREQKLEDRSIADIIASFGMTEKVGSLGGGTLNQSIPPSRPAPPIASRSGSNRQEKNSVESGAPNSAMQRWGIDMAPINPDKPVLANLRTVAGLPDLPAGGSSHDEAKGAYPSTPGGAKRRAEIAMSIIHSMAAAGDAIANQGSRGSYNNSNKSRPAFRG